jgi:hypothetical protein
MMENKKTEIKLSRLKLAKLLIFSVIFLLVGVWLIVKDPETKNTLFNNPVTKAVAAYGGTLMGLIGIYLFSGKLLDKKPGLTIDEHGVFDNTTAFSFGLIPWEDISAINERIVDVPLAAKQRFVAIGLVNPDKYISRVTNSIKRRLVLANTKGNGTPVNISANALKIKHADLLRTLNEAFEKYKR